MRSSPRQWVFSVVGALVVSSIGYARPDDAAPDALLQAAVVLRTFDHFSAACEQGGGFSDVQAKRIDAWRSGQGVEQVRARLPEVTRDPARQRLVEQSMTAIVKQLSAGGIEGCAAAIALTRTTQAQFSTVAPQLLAAVPTQSEPRRPDAPPITAAPASSPTRANAELLARVDGFGFDTRLIMGVGGFLTTDIYPVVLLRDGHALTRVEGLAFPGSVAEHQSTHAKAWTRWRREGGELQIAGEKGWRKLPFQTTYQRLPDGFRLNGLFRRLGGTGTLAVGGGDSVVAWSEYRFSDDGRVVRGSGAGGQSETGGTSVATQSIAPNRSGTYRVEGLMLHLTYDDGSTEDRVLIADPNDPTGAIWLDGAGYAQRRR